MSNLYPYYFIYNKKKCLLFWVDNLGGRFKLQSNSDLYMSCSKAKVIFELEDEEILICWEDDTSINFDKFWFELNNLDINKVSSVESCKILLDGWNFLEDMLRTFSLEKELIHLKSETLNKVYDKLFFGNNLEAIKKNNSDYNPMWEENELKEFKSIFWEIWQTLSVYTYKWGDLKED